MLNSNGNNIKDKKTSRQVKKKNAKKDSRMNEVGKRESRAIYINPKIVNQRNNQKSSNNNVQRRSH